MRQLWLWRRDAAALFAVTLRAALRAGSVRDAARVDAATAVIDRSGSRATAIRARSAQMLRSSPASLASPIIERWRREGERWTTAHTAVCVGDSGSMSGGRAIEQPCRKIEYRCVPPCRLNRAQPDRRGMLRLSRAPVSASLRTSSRFRKQCAVARETADGFRRSPPTLASPARELRSAIRFDAAQAAGATELAKPRQLRQWRGKCRS